MGGWSGGDVGEYRWLREGRLVGVVWEDGHCVDGTTPFERDDGLVGQCELRISAEAESDAFLLELMDGEEGVLMMRNEEDVGDNRSHGTIRCGNDARKVADGVTEDGLAVASCEDL